MKNRQTANPVAAVAGAQGRERAETAAPSLPPDVQRDLRLDALMDELTELEALEHFAELRRDAEERAW